VHPLSIFSYLHIQQKKVRDAFDSLAGSFDLCSLHFCGNVNRQQLILGPLSSVSVTILSCSTHKSRAQRVTIFMQELFLVDVNVVSRSYALFNLLFCIMQVCYTLAYEILSDFISDFAQDSL
jgi:hypothetical protein